jgi:hypothetical protein
MSNPSIKGTSNTFNVLSAVGWLDGWNYRKRHIIEDATGAGTGYQVPIVVDYGSGVDGGDTVYLDGRCQPDFADIRFTDDDCTTELDYWLESYTPAGSALFWVEVADNLSSSDATIYIYYGNTTVSTTSNGEATFLFFDDFHGISIDASKWTDFTNSCTVSDGTITLTSVDSIVHISQNSSNYPYSLFNIAVRSRNYRPRSEWNWVGLSHSSRDRTYDTAVFIHRGALNEGIIVWNDGEYTFSASNWIAGQWNIEEITWRNGEVSFYSNGAEVSNSPITSGNLPNEDMGAVMGCQTGIFVQCDWILIRNWVDPEPSHGDWGEEESFLNG